MQNQKNELISPETKGCSMQFFFPKRVGEGGETFSCNFLIEFATSFLLLFNPRHKFKKSIEMRI